MTVISPPASIHSPVGALLRQWRRRQRLSQLALALRAGVSARHLSFVESGRARPSREMVLRLAEWLELPLRARNELLLAAGFAPAFAELALQSGESAVTRVLLQRVLAGHEPYPALAVDRHWNVVAANRAIAPLLNCVSPHLQQQPINVLRNSLHPEGMAGRIANYAEWRSHLVGRLRRQIDITSDPVLAALHREVSAYPVSAVARELTVAEAGHEIAVPLIFDSPIGRMTLISTTMVFGTATDVMLSEIALETFFPQDDETMALLRQLAEHVPGAQ
jgi:transcriptional regulator with XRE-family HTH domain